MTRCQPILVFDVNETLLDITPLTPLFEEWFSEGAAMRTWFSELILYSQALTLAGEYVDFGTLAASMLRMRAEVSQVRLPTEAAERLKYQLTSLPAHSDVVPALIRMRDAGLRLVTLTNSGSEAQRQQLEHAEIGSLLDRQYSVETVRAFKPHPSTYAMVARAEGVDLGDLILVACHAWDTIGARLAGCRTAFITRPGNVEPSFSVSGRPDYVASSLLGFADALLAKRES